MDTNSNDIFSNLANFYYGKLNSLGNNIQNFFSIIPYDQHLLFAIAYTLTGVIFYLVKRSKNEVALKIVSAFSGFLLMLLFTIDIELSIKIELVGYMVIGMTGAYCFYHFNFEKTKKIFNMVIYHLLRIVVNFFYWLYRKIVFSTLIYFKENIVSIGQGKGIILPMFMQPKTTPEDYIKRRLYREQTIKDVLEHNIYESNPDFGIADVLTTKSPWWEYLEKIFASMNK